jgi:pyridoxine kinase
LPVVSPPPSILSVQSHVAYGYVGNRAAVFPLQRMGFDVVAVNTVQFSNHTGYGAWTGQLFTPEHVAQVLDGVQARGGFAGTRAVLSGYLGDPGLGRVVLDRAAALKARDPSVIHVCDPVMGDVGRGFFVKPGVPEFFRDEAAPRASVLTPNQFELEYLTGRAVGTLEDAVAAAASLHARGVETVLVTSLERRGAGAGRIEMLVSDARDGRFLVETEKLALDPPPNGSGDCTAALFCGARLKGYAAAEALGRTAAAILAVFRATAAQGTRELALIAAQDAFTLSGALPVTAL